MKRLNYAWRRAAVLNRTDCGAEEPAWASGAVRAGSACWVSAPCGLDTAASTGSSPVAASKAGILAVSSWPYDCGGCVGRQGLCAQGTGDNCCYWEYSGMRGAGRLGEGEKPTLKPAKLGVAAAP